jgi:uncharacterized repeat protein (TIGR04076 family)
MPEKTLPLVIEVVKIQGHCPVHRVGDCFAIRKGHQLEAQQPVCMRALQAISPYYVPLSRGLHPWDLGFSGPHGGATFQCMDPNCLSGGSTVTFRITNDENRITRQQPFDGRIPVRW